MAKSGKRRSVIMAENGTFRRPKRVAGHDSTASPRLARAAFDRMADFKLTLTEAKPMRMGLAANLLHHSPVGSPLFTL